MHSIRTTRAQRGRRLGRGFSYAEVLFAVSILSVGILGTAGAMSTAALDVYQGGRETVAAQQSQALMERIRNAASYEDLLSYADAPPAGATAPRPDYVDDNRNAWVAAAQAAFPGGQDQVQGRVTITQQGIVPNRLATITVSLDVPGRTGWAAPAFVTQVAEWP